MDTRFLKGAGILLALSSNILFAAPLSLVREGKPQCAIVMPDDPSKTEQVAADELATYIGKSTGAVVESVKEGRLPSLSPRPLHLIVVGKCRLAFDAGLKPDTLKNEEIFLVTKGANLFILGGDSSKTADPRYRSEESFGTFFAADEFIEKYLGVRWYWPGELGEIVPARKNLTVGNIRIRKSPDFDYRYIYGDHADDPAITRDQSLLWWRRQRIGSSRKGGPGTHAFNGWPGRFAKTHPEYFALQKDGTRMLDADHGGGHLCLSSPAVKKQIVADILERFKNPATKGAGVWPGDSPGLYGCTCPSCEALLDRNGPETGFNSRLVWQLVNDVAKEVGKSYPDRWIIGGSYSSHADIPKGMKFEPNVSVTICDGGLYWNKQDIAAFKKRITDWHKQVKNIYEWNYYAPGPGQFIIAPHYINEIWRWSKGRVNGAICEIDYGSEIKYGGNWPQWQVNALNMYVYMKSMWNVNRDVDAMVRDYCRDLFGPAEKPMERFHAGLEEVLQKNYATDVRADGKWETFWTRLYPAATVTRLMGYLDEAEQLAPPESVYAKRVAVVRRGFAPMKETSDAFAQREKFPVREIVCPSVAEGLASFDGKLDQAEWAKAARTERFVESGSGKKVATATEVLLMQDGKNLYVGWTAGLRNGQPLRAERNDKTQDVWWDDNIEVFLYAKDSFYQFILTSKAVLWNSKGKFGEYDTSWESGARVKTFVSPDFWSGELIIPLDALAGLEKPLPMANVTWSANFGRVYYDQNQEKPLDPQGKINWKEELHMWNPVFEAGFNNPKRAGIIKFP